MEAKRERARPHGGCRKDLDPSRGAGPARHRATPGSLAVAADPDIPAQVLGDDIDVASGEAVGIVGPSGSGKTTLLLVLGGLELATSGTVCVNGHHLSQMSEDELTVFRRDNIGFIFQSFHLIPTMTALENVAIPL